MSDFADAVAEVILAIPKGQTLSYGQVAVRAGRPGAPRAVVRCLRTLDVPNLPWWRVHRSDGTLAEQVAVEQARRLRKEGVEVVGRRVVPKGLKKKAAPKAPRASKRRSTARPASR